MLLKIYYKTDINTMNFMQIVYKVIDYYHFTVGRVLCYGKAT